MPENIRAAIVVIPILTICFIYLNKSIIKSFDDGSLIKLSILFVFTIFCSLIISNYPLFLIILFVFTMFLSNVIREKPLVFLFMIAVAPVVNWQIPGVFGINKISSVNIILVMTLSVLIPCFLNRERLSKNPANADYCDFALIGLFLTTAGVAFRETTFTDGVRGSIVAFLSILTPYLVFSRWPKSKESIDNMTLALAMPICALAAIGVLEALWRWHFFASVAAQWQDTRLMAGYSVRAGILRIHSTVLSSISFGYILSVASLLILGLEKDKIIKPNFYIIMFFISAALVATVSRGPWIGFMVGLITFLILESRSLVRFINYILVIAISLYGFSFTNMGIKLFNALPFVGTSYSNTIDYRELLWEKSLVLIEKRPFFGTTNFRKAPEMSELVQGQGIVDVVNTYLEVALSRGLIGLSFFLLFFICVIYELRKSSRMLTDEDHALKRMIHAYIGALVTTIVTIATTSSIGQISTMYWVLAALSVALARIARRSAPGSKLAAGSAGVNQ